jgi:hypothetical protein
LTHNEIYFFCSKYLHWIKRITFVTMGSIWLMKENIWKQMTNHRDLQCSNETEKRRESWKTRIGTRSNTIWAVHVWKEWVEIRNSSAEGRKKRYWALTREYDVNIENYPILSCPGDSSNFGKISKHHLYY